jgi:hypothetical protein
MLTPHQQWQKTTAAAHRQRLVMFEGVSARCINAWERDERKQKCAEVERLIGDDVAAMVFGEYVNVP